MFWFLNKLIVFNSNGVKMNSLDYNGVNVSRIFLIGIVLVSQCILHGGILLNLGQGYNGPFYTPCNPRHIKYFTFVTLCAAFVSSVVHRRSEL